MDNSNSSGVFKEKTTTSNLMDANLTPGKVPQDPYDSFMQTFSEGRETYGNFGDCIPDSKEAGGNLAKTQENIRERFNLDTQDNFGDDYGADKKLY